MNIKLQKAFTLIELSVVIFIIALLLAGLLGPVSTQIESRERQQTIDTMNDIMESLYGFAIINGRLPCPDKEGDGKEECSGSSLDGWLPWKTLGLNIQGDVWGNRFRYRVTSAFTEVDKFDLSKKGDITVLTRGDAPNTKSVEEGKAGLIISSTIPAVVVSHGKNGLGATTINGVRLNTDGQGDDEAHNNDDSIIDGRFYSRTFSQGDDECTDDVDEATPLCQFDDIVMWISSAILMNRMVRAERLP